MGYEYDHDCPFEAFITNLGKYNEGELVGEWVKFPTTSEELQKVFERIGIGSKDEFGNPYEEWFISDYDCYVSGLYDKLGEYESLDELNYLASKLQELDNHEYEHFQAAMQISDYFNFIGNFVLPLSEDEVEALQSEEARRAEEIAERKRKSSKKSTQKRNQKRAEIKAKAEAGDTEAMAEYKAILEKGRQNNRKQAERMRKLRMADPEYRAKMEEKERLALEREKKRQERATRKKKVALAELKEQAEKGNQEAIRELV